MTYFALVLLLTEAQATPPPVLRPSNVRRYSPIISFNLDPKKILNTAVRVAAREGRVDVLNEYIKKGADINSPSDQEMTALMYAALNCRTEAVRLLIKNRAKVNMRDSKGRTALMLAARASCVPAIRVLLHTSGIDLTLRDRIGRTAYDFAKTAAALEVGGPANHVTRLIRTRFSQGLPRAQK